MLKKALIGGAAVLGALAVISGVLPATQPTWAQASLVPDRLYPKNPAPMIPPATEAPPPSSRRLSAEQRTQQLHATIRRYGTPGARSWEDVLRGMLISDVAVRVCPQLAWNRQSADDITAAWNLDLNGDAAKAIVAQVTRQAVVDAGTNRAAFCMNAWARYGVDGSVASLMIRTERR